MNKLNELIAEMEKELMYCIDDYSKTKDRWAMGGMYQLSAFLPRLREVSKETKPISFGEKLQRDLGAG